MAMSGRKQTFIDNTMFFYRIIIKRPQPIVDATFVNFEYSIGSLN